MNQTIKTIIILTGALLASLSCVGCKVANINEPLFYSTIEGDIPPALGRGSVKGTVLSQIDESPLQDIEIWLCTDVSVGFTFNCTGKSGLTITDQNGVYWFRNLPPGNYAIAIKSPRTKGQFHVLALAKGKNVLDSKSAPMTLAAGQTIEVAPQKIAPAFADFPNPNESFLKLTYPVMGTTIQERKPNLSWEKNSRATEYIIKIYRKEGTNAPALDVILDNKKKNPVSTNDTSFTPTNDLPNGIYFWKVSAYKASQVLSESDEGLFIIGEIPF